MGKGVLRYRECHLKSRRDGRVGIALHPPTRPRDAHVRLDTVENRIVPGRHEKEDTTSPAVFSDKNAKNRRQGTVCPSRLCVLSAEATQGKDQVIERRGRYFFRVTPKLAEAKDQAIIHQKRSAMASLGGKAKH